MATVSQLKIQLGTDVKYRGGEVIQPQPPTPLPAPSLTIREGAQPEGTDLGVVKVQNGKLVFDMDDFDADFGVF
jgi:hypothetical protein